MNPRRSTAEHIEIAPRHAQRKDALLGRYEYECVQQDIALSSSDSLSKEQLGNDDLGFLIENELLHEASIKYEKSRVDETTRLAAECEQWLQSDGSGDSVTPWEQGIPAPLRADCYRRLLAKDTEHLRSQLATYQELLKKGPASGTEAIADIEKDLDRTFPGHAYIDTEKGRQALRNMLTAYAVSNPELGYCQSMNYIAAVVLVVMEADGDAANEEQAFWTFAAIENCIVPQYHVHGLLGCRMDSRVLFSLVKLNLPTLHRHLSDMQVVPEISFLSWFMCLFINTLPIKSVLRVWDCLLAQNKDILLRVGLAVLEMCERVLLVADNPFDLNQTLQVRRCLLRSRRRVLLVKLSSASQHVYTGRAQANQRCGQAHADRARR